MPTTVTATIGVARDYTSLQDAYDDIGVGLGSGTDLVSNDEEIVLELHADAIYRERVTFDRGLTTDSTRRVIIRPASGDEHEGVINTSKVVFAPSSGSGHNFTVLDNFIKFERLQVAGYSGAGSDSSDEGFRIGDSTHNAEGTEIFGCLIYGGGASADQDGVYAGNWDAGTSSNPILVRDCAIWGWGRGGIFPQAFNQTPDQYWQIVNCICVANQYGIPYRTGLVGTLVDLEIVNTIVFDNSSYNYGATGTSNGTLVTTGSSNNFDSAGGGETLPGLGTPNPFTETESTSPGAGDWGIFENFDGSIVTYDLRLVNDSDNDLLGAGVGPASNSLVSTVDALGNTRSGTTCDPGFFEATVSAVTEDGDLLSGEGTLIAGSLEYTEDADLLSGEGTLIAGSLEETTSGDLLSGEGSLLAGALEYTETSALLTGEGTLPAGSDSSATDEAGDLLSGEGTLPAGALEYTESATVLSGEGSVPAGSLEETVAGDALAGEGNLLAGSLEHTETGDLISGEGTLLAGALGDEAQADLLSGEGSLPEGSLEYTERAAVLSGEGSLPSGTDGSSLIESADLLSGEGVLVAGALEYTESADLLTGEGTLIAGTDTVPGSETEEGDLLTAEGTLPSGAVAQGSAGDLLTGEGTLPAAGRPQETIEGGVLNATGSLPGGIIAGTQLENGDVLTGEVSTGGVTWIRIYEDADVLVGEGEVPAGTAGDFQTIQNGELLTAIANLPGGELEYTENAEVLVGEGYLTLVSEGGNILEGRALVANGLLPAGETEVTAIGDLLFGFGGGVLGRGGLTATVYGDLLSGEGTLPDGTYENPGEAQGDVLRAAVSLSEAYDYKFLVANTQRIYQRLHQIINDGPFYHVSYNPVTFEQELVSTTPIQPASVVLNEIDSEFGNSRVKSRLRFARTRWAWVAYVDFNVNAIVEPFEERWLSNPTTLPRDQNNGLDAVMIQFDRATYRHGALQEPESGTSFELSFFCTPLEG